MATSDRILKKYTWLIKTILNAKEITLKELNFLWTEDNTVRMKEEGKMSETTFFHYKKAIRELFGINIVCRYGKGRPYFIENHESLNKPSLTAWLYAGLASIDYLTEDENLHKKIIFEDSLGGCHLIPTILQAIKDNKLLNITYLPINSYYPIKVNFKPYYLKQHHRNWYMIGSPENSNQCHVLPLGEIITITLTDHTSNPEDSEKIFSRLNEVIGIDMNEAVKCEKVLIRFRGEQRGYISAVPLHASQKYIAATKEYTDYEYTLIPDSDFLSEILRLGTSAEILTPLWLREEMLHIIDQIKKTYHSQ
ncbi:MAG: WYL domain-containing protein [Muribaculaceae bacterium]|nr:WYL domain-containing protein [Muribaculaceae bacterium]